MYTRLIYLVSLVLVLGLVGNVQADVVWNDSTGDHLWSTGENWQRGTVPTTADGYVRIFLVPGPTIIANEVAVVGGMHIGRDGEPGELTVDGGTLEVLGGSLNLGYQGPGTLNMIGGTITLTNVLKIGRDATAVGHVNLDGGIISTNNFLMREKAGSVGTMDVRAGTLIIDDDMLLLVQGYIDSGWITAYDGDGTLQRDYDITNEGRTTLTAIHNLNPNPIDGGLGSVGDIELSWTLPDPGVAGEPVLVDVYFTDDWAALYSFTDPAAMQVVNNANVTSIAVQTQPKTQYYWAVDTYVGDPNDPIFGPIFSFIADNPVPVVDAGADLVTWLEDGVRTKLVDTTVTDNGAYTAQWSVVSEPNAAPIDIQIANGDDDAEQHVGDGRMDIGSSDLEIANEDAGDPATNEQVIGLRFVDVPMENGAPVANAYVEVEVDKVDKQGSAAPVNLIIEGELAPDAAPFENVANNITDRAVTTAQVKWSIPAWTEQNAKFQTPDISSIIMEINSQRNWASGNAIVLILRDDKDNPSTGLREAESFNGEEAAAPLLHIDLAGGPVVIETPTADDTNVTLSRLGEYVLQLDAFDGEYTGSDTVAINVYRDGCEAAKSLPDYVPFPGDLNGDCIVDELDLAILEADWLKETSLIEP